MAQRTPFRHARSDDADPANQASSRLEQPARLFINLSLHAVYLSTVASVLVSLGFSPLPQRRVNFGTHTL